MQHDRIVSLEAIYTAERGATFMTGIQALVRLPLMQRRADRNRGLHTAGLVSGYRGSPLGGYDQQLWKAQKYLDAHQIVFQPGLNEDLAATALWGAQMHKAFGPTKVDGVFGIWYGKGNGVDRTGDVFRNANMLGTSPLGGVLAIGGDDHAAQSSMFPHQTDGVFQSVFMPVLQPANVSEILTLGLAGIALSRFAGVWVAMKTIAEVVESAASFELPEPYPVYESPRHLVPAHGLNWDSTIQWPAERAEYERRMIDERIPAVIGWATANRVDKAVITSCRTRLCVVTVGKAHQDLMQALQDLGIGKTEASELGISVYKVAMSWPLATQPLLAFAGGADEIFVVEEKGPTVENQIKAALSNYSERRVRITGKTDENGQPLLPVVMEFTPLIVAKALVGRLRHDPIGIDSRLKTLCQSSAVSGSATFPGRAPFFCSGCPHNSSTKTPEGSISGGGIGCHVMALSVPKLKTTTFSQMGGEGMQWVGASPFSETTHIFQNLGDGTYQHSGLLAVRAAVASNANITFKILYNDAVAMTGGQPAEGAIDPLGIIRQLKAEGVGQVWLVSDTPTKWAAEAVDALVGHRDEMDGVQKQLREIPGVTAIVYEQTCAAEKRRRRKRGSFEDPDRRLFINSRVCEGCGDCSAQSNCIAVQPLATPDGTKRKIDQSACNKDFSCVKGFCPSFVEVDGPVLRKPDPERIQAIEAQLFAGLSEPEMAALDDVYNVFVAGIGGLGVLTVGALLGTAAHLDGHVSTVLDFTGLAQKNGAVVSQVRIAAEGQPIHAVRVSDRTADLVLAIDTVVASSAASLNKLSLGRGAIVLNSDETPTADAVLYRDAKLPTARMIEALLNGSAGKGFSLNATRLAEGLFGNNVAANTLMVGYAWQKGLLPLSSEALNAAIEANGAAVDLNKRAFSWGRLAALDPDTVDRIAGIAESEPFVEEALPVAIKRRTDELCKYQDRSYADRYSALVERVSVAATSFGKQGQALLEAVATNAYKVMAYKDEYEIARLYSDHSFRDALGAQFTNMKRVSLYLAPPVLSRTDPCTGRPRKRKFGPWIFLFMALLAKGKRLRGSWMDPFGRTEERKAERALRDQYLNDIAILLDKLEASSFQTVLAIAQLPGDVRGFGPVKDAAMKRYFAARARLFAELDS